MQKPTPDDSEKEEHEKFKATMRAKLDKPPERMNATTFMVCVFLTAMGGIAAYNQNWICAFLDAVLVLLNVILSSWRYKTELMFYRQLKNIKALEGRRILNASIVGLRTVLANNPNNWSARWMLGKAQQALKQHEQAYESFLEAHRDVLTNENVMRELALECLQTKRYSQAVHYCHVAIEFSPEDYSLWPNMATAHLFNKNLDEAESWAKKSLEKIPDDEPAMAVLKMVKEIRAGKRPIPTDFAALENDEDI